MNIHLLDADFAMVLEGNPDGSYRCQMGDGRRFDAVFSPHPPVIGAKFDIILLSDEDWGHTTMNGKITRYSVKRIIDY